MIRLVTMTPRVGPAAVYDNFPSPTCAKRPTVDIDEPLREEMVKLLQFTRARDTPRGVEHRAGDAGQLGGQLTLLLAGMREVGLSDHKSAWRTNEILPEQLSEVGGLSVYRQVGAVDHRQRLLTERANERGRRMLGRRWARRPEQAGNHRDGDGKAPAVAGTAAARSSPAHERMSCVIVITPCCRALPIGPC